MTVLVVGQSRAARLSTQLFEGLGVQVIDADAVRSSNIGDHFDVIVLFDADCQGEGDDLAGISIDGRTVKSDVRAVVDEGDVFFSTMADGRRERSADVLVAAASGALLGCSDPGRPRPVELPLVDFATALTVVTGTLANLTGRAGMNATAELRIDPRRASSLLTIDALIQSINAGEEMARNSRHPWAQVFIVECSCGSALTIHVSSSHQFWTRLADVLGRSDLVDLPQFASYDDRVANYSELANIVSTEVRKQSSDVWQILLAAADVPFAPLFTPLEAVSQPQAEWLGLATPDCVPAGRTLLRPLRFDGDLPAMAGGKDAS
ncbi:CoA transferase [Rhodococcus opacus]|uniref:CoA transferase n=1 Tax=Rhodococcus opacus TaxID=37919 RepID=UPI00146CECDB|nr:CoA transferase [Rhodococcus opacus]